MSASQNDAKRLPGSYNRTTDSVCERMLRIVAEAHRDASADLHAIHCSLDLSEASGKTLDLYGALLLLPRGVVDDTQYRFLLKCRIEHYFAKSTHAGVIQSMESIFSLQPGEVSFTDATTSGLVAINHLPYSALQRAGFTGEQTVQIIKELLSVGVDLEMGSFEGTFCFSDADDIYDEAQGFGNEEQTIGGYLGYLVGIDNSLPLPL